MKALHNLPYEKVGNQEPVCIANKVPFEIPASWEWVRLGTILTKLTDGTHSRPKYTEKGIPFISVKDISNGKLEFSNCKYISNEEHKILYKRCNPQYGDILLTKVGTTGIPVVIDCEMEFSLFVSVALLKFNQLLINNEYLKYLISSPLVQKQATQNTRGVGNKNWVMKDIANTLVVIPPLNEQKRIVQKLLTFEPLIKKYHLIHAKLKQINDKFPSNLKNSILQYATQGKLVSQNLSDEAADILLKHINNEKKQLQKEGKLKKDKNKSIIFRRDNSYYEKLDGVDRCIDDEIPFDIPDSWEWVRLGKISTYAESKKKINVLNVDSDLWQLDLEDIERGGKILRFKTVKEGKGVGDKTFFSKGDILYSKLRPYLLKILIAPADGICTPEIVPFQLYAGIIPEYIVAFLKSPYVDSVINSVTYGIKMPRVGTQTMVSLLVPVPPLEEQKRIVEYINKILPLISKL